MEYCDGGDMAQLIKKCKKDKDFIAEDVIWKIFMQIILAISECHHRPEGKVLHRDLKPGNVFLDSHNNVKLGDFGLSKILSKDAEYASTHVGTPYYMSPEQIKESNYNEKSDIWSAGCVLYEIAALKPPFDATNQLALAMKIKSGKFERLPIRYSEELQKVVSWMIRLNPEERPSTDALLNLPQISLRLKEQNLKDNYNLLKKKEEELQKNENLYKQKEEEIQKQMEKLKEKEKELQNLEMSLINSSNTGIGSTKSTDNSNSINPTDALEDRYYTQNSFFKNTDIDLSKRIDKIYSQPHLLKLNSEGKRDKLKAFGGLLCKTNTIFTAEKEIKVRKINFVGGGNKRYVIDPEKK